MIHREENIRSAFNKKVISRFYLFVLVNSPLNSLWLSSTLHGLDTLDWGGNNSH